MATVGIMAMSIVIKIEVFKIYSPSLMIKARPETFNGSSFINTVIS